MHPNCDLPDDVRRYANRVICAVADAHGVLLSDIIVGLVCYRSRPVAAARGVAVLRLRAEIIQRWGPVRGKPECFAIRNGETGPGWFPASTMTLAAIFNTDHSTIVRVLNRAEGRRQEARGKAQATGQRESSPSPGRDGAPAGKSGGAADDRGSTRIGSVPVSSARIRVDPRPRPVLCGG